MASQGSCTEDPPEAGRPITLRQPNQGDFFVVLAPTEDSAGKQPQIIVLAGSVTPYRNDTDRELAFRQVGELPDSPFVPSILYLAGIELLLPDRLFHSLLLRALDSPQYHIRTCHHSLHPRCPSGRSDVVRPTSNHS